MKLVPIWDGLAQRRTFIIEDDFEWYISPHRWTSLAADAGASVAAGNGQAGLLVMTTGATQENECAFATTNKPFLFDSSHPLIFEALVQMSEANTNGLEPVFGFSSVMNSANMMQDAEAGPAASFSGAILYKTGGGLNWSFRTSIGTTKLDTATSQVVGDSAYHCLRIEVRIGSQGTGYLEAVPFYDGQQMTDLNGKPIKQTFLSTSAAAMQAGAYLKTGTASTSEVVNVDYVKAAQLRPWPFL